MKLLTTVLICLLASGLIAQKKKDIPPGFELVKERGLVVSRTEITVKQWVEYMNARGEDSREALAPLNNAINDKCVCLKTDGYWEIFYPDAIVFRDTTFIEVDSKKGKKTRAREYCPDLPITGITLEQAQGFAAWLTEKYDSDDKYAGLGLVFRLPTPIEMDSLLTDILGDFKPGQENYDAYANGINSHGCAIYNHAHNSWCDNNKNMKLRYGYGVPMETKIFFPDWNGLYDLMGNVAEMTNEPGVAKGGSCKDAASACQPGAVNQYDGPNTWLGFRVLAELQ